MAKWGRDWGVTFALALEKNYISRTKLWLFGRSVHSLERPVLSTGTFIFSLLPVNCLTDLRKTTITLFGLCYVQSSQYQLTVTLTNLSKLNIYFVTLLSISPGNPIENLGKINFFFTVPPSMLYVYCMFLRILAPRKTFPCTLIQYSCHLTVATVS